MLFNSWTFVFLFMPLVISGFYLAGRAGSPRRPVIWLVLSSVFFYACWNVNDVFLLFLSILTNYFISGEILKRKENSENHTGIFFWLGVAFNLGLLSYYKYFPFVSEALFVSGASSVSMPLGISFFTVTQLLYLTDAYCGSVRGHDFFEYVLLVVFFPHLMAGPILFHKEMMTEWQDASRLKVNWQNLSRGLMIFIIGLSRKTLIADSLSEYVASSYASAENLTMFEAYLAASSYMLQQYFDFSGYSDMATGLALMMNFEIPVNFNRPFHARNLINFWQRWHISLTNAITALVYMPFLRSLGEISSRNMIISSSFTLFVVGIWHGASWNFIIFALLHAVGVAVNYMWKKKPMGKIPGRILTLFFILITTVFFRASSVKNAIDMLSGMIGLHGVAFPNSVANLAAHINVTLPIGNVPGSLPKAVFLAAILIAAYLPESWQMKLRPSIPFASILIVIFTASILAMTRPSEFLYFQF